jgi:hypothetical protein
MTLTPLIALIVDAGQCMGELNGVKSLGSE